MIPASNLGTGQQLQILFDSLLRQNLDQHVIHEQGLRDRQTLLDSLL